MAGEARYRLLGSGGAAEGGTIKGRRPMKHASLTDAVAGNVRPGDTVLLTVGHSRWTAAARELVRQTWGSDPHFTLVMLSL